MAEKTSDDLRPPELIVNTSPIVTLSKVGRLDLLFSDTRPVVVPKAVAEEIRAGPANDPARIALETERLGEPVMADPLPSVLEWGLGAGESAVLSLAIARRALAVMDDREARRAARSLGVGVVGTLGLVLHAAKHGRVESPATLVQALRNVGLRLDDGAVAHAFETILGKPWK